VAFAACTCESKVSNAPEPEGEDVVEEFSTKITEFVNRDCEYSDSYKKLVESGDYSSSNNEVYVVEEVSANKKDTKTPDEADSKPKRGWCAIL